MHSELPKVLHPLSGKPLIAHVIDNIHRAGIEDIIIVVGYRGDDVIKAVSGVSGFVWQHEQRGTGHAVMQAAEALNGFAGHVLIACGDVPLITPVTIRGMIDESRKPNVKAVVLSMIPDSPRGYGRIIKDDDGNLARIVEEKDANDEEKKILEVNTGTYIFNKDSLFSGLKTINTNNAQGEYYLPDALKYIRSAGWIIRTVCLKDPIEGSGINSQEELLKLEGYFNKII
jgi:UDP-N-acetylglucosamine diphosphorylase/glucosamine-1-phosphate N-acetyltransferase